MVKFGKRAADWEEEVANQDTSAFIRGMKNGENRLRILDEIDDWVAYREHYDVGIYYYPCAREAGEPTCVGCSSSSEKVRDRQRRFAFNAWDEKDELIIAKVGKRVYDTMQIRKDRSDDKTITDRDFIITKSGKGKDTSYDVEGLRPEKVDDDGERLDIYEALAKKYEAAVAWYGAQDGHEEAAPAEPDAPTTGSRRRRGSTSDADAAAAEDAAPRTRTRARADKPAEDAQPEAAKPAAKATKATPARGRARAQAAATPPAEENDEAQQTLPESNGEPAPEFAEMDKLELRAWLDEHNIDWDEKQPRSVLVMLCEKAAA